MRVVWCLLMTALATEAYHEAYSRNMAEREEPTLADSYSIHMKERLWRELREQCPEGEAKTDPECKYGTYFNEMCGRSECYRGPDEECTEGLVYANNDKRCAFGYKCSKYLGICLGMGSKLSPPLLPHGWSVVQRRRLAE